MNFNSPIFLYLAVMAMVWARYIIWKRRGTEKYIAIKAAAVEAGLTEPSSPCILSLIRRSALAVGLAQQPVLNTIFPATSLPHNFFNPAGRANFWYSWGVSNLRPPDPQSGALTN